MNENELSSASQPNDPLVQVRTLFEVHEVRPAPKNCVVVASVDDEVMALMSVEKKLVEVAEVVVLRLAINPPVKVDEAVEINPLSKPIVVEVETP